MLELAGRVSNISDEELCFDKQNHFVFKCELLTKLAQAQNERLCVTDGSLQWTQSVSWSLSEGTARSLSDEKIICIIPAPNSKWEKALKMLNVDVRLGQAGPLTATGVGWYKLLADCLLCPSCCCYTTTHHTVRCCSVCQLHPASVPLVWWKQVQQTLVCTHCMVCHVSPLYRKGKAGTFYLVQTCIYSNLQSAKAGRCWQGNVDPMIRLDDWW